MHPILSDSTTFVEHVSKYLDNNGILWIGLLVLLQPAIRRYLGLEAWLGLGVLCTVILIGLTSYHTAAEGWRASSRPECLWGSALMAAQEFSLFYGVPVGASMTISWYMRRFKPVLLVEIPVTVAGAVCAWVPAVWLMLYIKQQDNWCLPL